MDGNEKVGVVILSFEHFKEFGVNGIYLAMLKDSIDHLELLISSVFVVYHVLG